MAAGNFAAACPKYDESQRRSPDLDTLLKLADCYEKAGKTASAWGAFKEAIDTASRRHAPGATDPKEESARSRAAALEPKISRLTITVTAAETAGLEVQQDGVVVGRGAWGSAMPIDPGSYQLMAKAPGKKPWTHTAVVGANGAKVEITVPGLENESAVALVPAVGAPGQGGPGPVDASRWQTQGSTWSSQRTIGFVVGGVGVAALAVGTVFGLMSRSKISDSENICPSNVHCSRMEFDQIKALNDDARTDATWSNIGFVVGIIGVAGGAALVLTAPKPSDGGRAVSVAPWVGTAGAGVTMGGKW